MAIKRHIRTEEIAELVAYIASPHAAMMAGATHTIDGGMAREGAKCRGQKKLVRSIRSALGHKLTFRKRSPRGPLRGQKLTQ